MELVIVESPGKVKKIAAILGDGFTVRASIGHIRDLPERGLGIDIENGFQELFEVLPDKKKTVEMLKSAAAKATSIYLAADPDREGEAIAWHIAEVLPERDRRKIKRITFNQITSDVVSTAIENHRQIDAHLVEAQSARRVLDRLIGYMTSPLLRHVWGLQSKKKLSSGRVQTAALRVVVEREQARRNFKPQTFWQIYVQLEKDGMAFWARMVQPTSVNSREELQPILDDLTSASAWWVSELIEKASSKAPPAPFTTSTLQQEASQRLSFNPKRTDQISQRLYEAGLITYIRTDSTQVAPEAQRAAREVIAANFGPEYLPDSPPIYQAGFDAQEAHEAIRPSNPAVLPDQVSIEELSLDDIRLYTLIHRRFLTSQMKSAIFSIVEVQILAGSSEEPLPYAFLTRSRMRVFDGYQILYEELRDADEQPEIEDEQVQLPALYQGDALDIQKLEPREKKTQPPHQYTQARLIAELDRLGIGRPSTFAATVETLLDRGYVQMKKKHIVPTPLGEQVLGLMIEHFPTLFRIDFTATMEKLLDHVAHGKIARDQVLGSFYHRTLAPAVEAAQQAAAKSLPTTDERCPECGKPLIVKSGKRGVFASCSGWPACKFSQDLAKEVAR